MRDSALDIAKGILIFLVVWGHSIQFGFGYEYGENSQYLDDYVFRAIYSFHMSLFMAISGYLFYYSNKKPFKEVFLSKIKSIGIPYLAYCTIYVLVLVPILIRARNGELVLSTYKNGFWFLTSVLLNCFVVSLVTLLSRNRWIVSSLLLSINFGLWFVNEDYLYNTHNYMFTCFIFGYLYNAFLERPMTFKKTSLIRVFVAVAVFLMCVSIFKGDLYVYSSGVCLIRDDKFSFHQLRIDTLRCLIGFVASLCFLSLIPYTTYLKVKAKKAICMLSRYSIGIYCLSTILLTIYYKIMGRLNINIAHNYIYPVILASIVTWLSYILLKYCGKKVWLNRLFLGGR